ncbi:hypothetical protein AD941_08415 [Gluconobacter albidus]|uniref:Transposase n=1 Tax=Gluconobacter albidus TaxID=318683 RepID=A0AAW3QWP3_9PROT|nr:hypothetical protein AD941_08415 [Gluconobacter albidus]
MRSAVPYLLAVWRGSPQDNITRCRSFPNRVRGLKSSRSVLVESPSMKAQKPHTEDHNTHFSHEEDSLTMDRRSIFSLS